MDSFFDFDTNLPPMAGADNNGRGGAAGRLIDSEDEYDALNGETFGPDPDKGDWENMHESLVRLENGGNGITTTDNAILGTEALGLFDDDEIDLHFPKLELTDGDESLCSSGADLSLDDDLCTRLRLDLSIWDSPVKQPAVQTFPQSLVQNGMIRPPGFHLHAPNVPIKMMSVEDIERNIIEQQRQECLKKEKEQQRKLQQENRKNKESKQHKQQSPGSMTVTPMIQPLLPPAQLLTPRSQMFPPPPLLNHQSRVPVGFLPYSFLPTHYPAPINNLAMHPGFPAGIVRPQLGLIPRIPVPIQPNIIQNIQTSQFNRKLVEEIQQNHPLLSFHRQQNLHSNSNYKNHSNQRFHPNNIPNGISFDQHANMMTNREKQWLIGIQLTQLNSDTPYISDYYFTVYKERLRAKSKASNANQAYQDNQRNHPFTTQPRNHAQLLLMSSLTRGGSAGGSTANHRDRKNSETTAKNGNEGQKDQQQNHRSYTPLQFENSLGKLQCGSVKAPRKMIDMDVVGNESAPSRPPRELSMQRKSRHVLLHIETLYKVVLKMEDLNNPVAIRAAAIAKEKREREQQQSNDGFSEEIEPECFDELLAELMGGLTHDKVTPMLSVRKGKVLLRRICVLMRDDPSRWALWRSIFSAIPLLLKKDRDDRDGVLFALYTEFERHVQYSAFPDLLKLAQVIATEKILSYLTGCKFLLSSIITIVFQMEVFIAKKSPNMATASEVDTWVQCLSLVMETTGKLLSGSGAVKISAHHTIKIERENNIVRTIRAHLDRFSEHVKGNDFLDFITDGIRSSGDNGSKAVAVTDTK
ncbi:hypothetical protein RP20_CCG027188 [Aedes albopictus]|nr:hypothetical protein RP20_CCG027188 [Aedes albopictus]